MKVTTAVAQMALTLAQALEGEAEGIIVRAPSAQLVHKAEVLVPHGIRHLSLKGPHLHWEAVLQGCQDCTYKCRIATGRLIVKIEDVARESEALRSVWLLGIGLCRPGYARLEDGFSRATCL
jgi:hypothetical protein